jgi:AraC family transcriptional regulator
MELQTLWLDRADVQDKLGQDGAPACHLAALSRSASLGLAEGQSSFWLVLRGDAQLSCREGTFALQAGDWIAVDRDSRPTLLSGRRTLAIALVLPAGHAFEPSDLPPIHPGRGRADARAMRMALRLWRSLGCFGPCNRIASPDSDAAMRRILHFLSSLQDGLHPMVDRCPGRSLRRKRQVFARMQRARLYLDGNAGHQVRLAELAGLCNFSVWYFTKTFHALYEEGPRQAMAHVRLQQASDLLARTSLSVGEVGAACGFESPCSFARAFRAHYGTTASDYRSVRRSGKTPDHAKRSSA